MYPLEPDGIYEQMCKRLQPSHLPMCIKNTNLIQTFVFLFTHHHNFIFVIFNRIIFTKYYKDSYEVGGWNLNIVDYKGT